MSVTEGGLRDRMILESVHHLVKGCLQTIGWLTPNPKRRDVNWMAEPAPDGKKIELNSVGVFPEHIPSVDDFLELGNTAAYNNHQWYADVYAENEALAVQLAGDIRAILRGRMPDVGAARPVLDVYDFTLATPVVIFSCDIEHVGWDRPPSYTHPWQEHWMVVPFTIVDIS